MNDAFDHEEIHPDFIQHAIKHPGALHRKLHVPEGEKIPLSKIEKATHSRSLTTRREADLALTLRHINHGRK